MINVQSFLAFHHFGLGVKDPENALKFVKMQGYEVEAEMFDPLQNVNLILCSSKTAPSIEIIYPGSEGHCPLEPILKRFQAGIYHLCYECANYDGFLRELEETGLRQFTISPPKEACLFGGDLASFHHVTNVGLIELIHRRS